jgi:hypothetical protein
MADGPAARTRIPSAGAAGFIQKSIEVPVRQRRRPIAPNPKALKKCLSKSKKTQEIETDEPP